MKPLKALALSLITVLAPVQSAAVTILVLILSDLVLGCLASAKRKEPITSSGLRRTITKLFVFETVLVLGFLTETYLTGDLIPVVKIISTFIGLVELKSIMENLNEINGEPILNSLIVKLGSTNDHERSDIDGKR